MFVLVGVCVGFVLWVFWFCVCVLVCVGVCVLVLRCVIDVFVACRCDLFA